MTSSSEWIGAFAQRLGIGAPSDEDIEIVLALAGCAAHASERTAAPVACWLAAQSNIPLAEALELAQAITTATDELLEE
ncbi:MAG TPA: DUF6457 domain-containing protein [Acidimicrobiales bacterium]